MINARYPAIGPSRRIARVVSRIERLGYHWNKKFTAIIELHDTKINYIECFGCHES